MAHYRTLAELDEAAEPAPVGLAAIAAEFSAGAGPVMAAARAGAAVDTPEPGHQGGPLVSSDDVWINPMPVGFLSAAGTIDENVVGPDWGPPTGWVWRITEVPIILGAGTTLVQIFLEAGNSGKGPIFQTGVSGLWEPSRLFLQYGERMVAVSTAGGVTISPRAERIRTHFAPTYMA